MLGKVASYTLFFSFKRLILRAFTSLSLNTILLPFFTTHTLFGKLVEKLRKVAGYAFRPFHQVWILGFTNALIAFL